MLQITILFQEFGTSGMEPRMVQHYGREPNRPGSSECKFEKGVKMSSTEAREDDIATEIGAQLRFMYDNVLREPLPNKFSELMERLEAGTIVPLPVVKRSTERADSLGTTGLPKAVNDYDQRVRRRARMG
jgi:hypothetical protein